MADIYSDFLIEALYQADYLDEEDPEDLTEDPFGDDGIFPFDL